MIWSVWTAKLAVHKTPMIALSLTFEPSPWFEQGLLQSAVEMKIKSLVLCNIILHSRKQHQVVESLGHSLFQIRGEDSTRKGKFSDKWLRIELFNVKCMPKTTDGSPCCLVHGGCSPCLRFCQIQNLFPVWECWDYFKCLGQFATAVFWQNLKQKRKTLNLSTSSCSELLRDLYCKGKVDKSHYSTVNI